MTKPPEDQLDQIDQAARDSLAGLGSATELEAWRVKYLGRQGEVPRILRTVKDLPADQRGAFGQAANQLRQELEAAYQEKKQLMPSSLSAEASAKVEAPSPDGRRMGHLHPITLTIRRIQSIFADMGFIIAEGPLAEDPIYNFDMLNIPMSHPARSETDTFQLTNGAVLRTHTSPVQLRAVLEMDLTPPFSVISPGRVFRAESTDASHEHTFHQLEAIMVGKSVTVADFKGVVEKYFTEFFEQTVSTRLRPSYFPFVEPGFEVDMSCVICNQAGCSVCGHTGWLEMIGAGMVHPNVLKNMNVDHTKWQGFAFGGGIDRLAMLRHNINDVRLFMSGKLDFLSQFS